MPTITSERTVAQHVLQATVHRDQLPAVATSAEAVYERIATQAAAIDKSVARLAKRGGNNANALWWLKAGSNVGVGGFLVGAAATVIGVIGSLVAIGDPVIVEALVATGTSAATAAGGVFLGMRCSEKAAAIKDKKFTTDEIQPLLANIAHLAPAEIAAMHDTINDAVQPLRNNLSAKAAHALTEALASDVEAPTEQRVGQLFALLKKARASETELNLGEVRAILDQAPPTERRALGDLLDATLFKNELYLYGKDDTGALKLVLEAQRTPDRA